MRYFENSSRQEIPARNNIDDTNINIHCVNILKPISTCLNIFFISTGSMSFARAVLPCEQRNFLTLSQRRELKNSSVRRVGPYGRGHIIVKTVVVPS